MPSNSNRGVVYLKPGSVEVQKIDFPTFQGRNDEYLRLRPAHGSRPHDSTGRHGART